MKAQGYHILAGIDFKSDTKVMTLLNLLEKWESEYQFTWSSAKACSTGPQPPPPLPPPPNTNGISRIPEKGCVNHVSIAK